MSARPPSLYSFVPFVAIVWLIAPAAIFRLLSSTVYFGCQFSDGWRMYGTCLTDIPFSRIHCLIISTILDGTPPRSPTFLNRGKCRSP